VQAHQKWCTSRHLVFAEYAGACDGVGEWADVSAGAGECRLTGLESAPCMTTAASCKTYLFDAHGKGRNVGEWEGVCARVYP